MSFTLQRVVSYLSPARPRLVPVLLQTSPVGPASSTCDSRQVATQSKTRSKKPSTLVQAAVRGTISDDSPEFRPATGRYHLYVSLACPWAQRTLIARNLKGLDDVVTSDVVHWKLTDRGWLFDDTAPACTKDSVNGFAGIEHIYRHAIPDYKGKMTVPVLWDKQNNTMVNNKSKDIVRMFNTNFQQFCRTEEQRRLDLYPPRLREEIDDLEDVINSDLGQGVYKAGRAITEHTYNKAVGKVFDTLDMSCCWSTSSPRAIGLPEQDFVGCFVMAHHMTCQTKTPLSHDGGDPWEGAVQFLLDGILSKKRYLTGDSITEVDVGLYTILVRFDRIYYKRFNCNRKRIADYANLRPYFEDLVARSPFSQSTNFEHIDKFYEDGD